MWLECDYWTTTSAACHVAQANCTRRFEMRRLSRAYGTWKRFRNRDSLTIRVANLY